MIAKNWRGGIPRRKAGQKRGRPKRFTYKANSLTHSWAGLSSTPATRYLMGAKCRIPVEKSCHDRQDELSRLFYSAGHTVQKRLARRKSVPRHCRLADRGGNQWSGSRRHPGREPDTVA